MDAVCGVEMLCLHGKPTGKIKTEKGLTLWVCQQPSTCHFSCSEDEKYLYSGAVEDFLSTSQPRPLCCMGEGMRNYAKMKVVTDMGKESFGRPFFVCSKKDQSDQCNYFEWGDQRIVETPLCKHGKPSRMLKVKKEGPNKDRSFFCCREREENRCKFFKWIVGDAEEDPLMPGCIVLFSMPPSYKYTVKKTGAMFTSHEQDRKKAYAEFLRSNRREDAPDILQSHIALLRTQHPSLFGPSADPYKKELLEKRLSSPLQQHLVSSTDDSKGNENETVVKKRKTLLPCE